MPIASQSAAEVAEIWKQGKEEKELQLLELQQEIQLSRLLHQIDTAIGSTLDLDEVLTIACRLLGQTLNCSRVNILVDETEDSTILVTRGEYNSGEYPSQLGIPVPLRDNPHLQQLLDRAESLAVTRFLEFPGLGEQTRELARNLGIQSILAIATRYKGKVNGILGVHQCDREREWTQWERDLIEGVASQLAIAINQAQLYSASRTAAEREALLRLVTNQIRSSLDLNTVLQTAVKGVRQLLKTDRVVIYRFKEDWKGEIVVEDLAVPWPSIFKNVVADNCFRGEYAYLYKKGRVRAIDDIFNSGLDPCHANYLDRLQVKANLIVPIVIQDNLWGLLIAHECHSTRHWLQQEVELLEQLGNQMAIAIAQAELYQQVQESAAKYQAQAEQLQTTLEELRATQQQLIQSEKLSSLGQMVAGVAHEINNANNFIHANLFYAKDYIESLTKALDLYAEVVPETPEAIAQLNEDVDLDYIRKDSPNLIGSMQQGSARIRTIVQTMRNFSRLDESESKPADLAEGMESSLAMLQHRFDPNLTICKRYESIPQVECRPAQLNQVFFNLLDNALDAISTTGKAGELTIAIAQNHPDWVTISIKDNGSGIPQEVQDRIFDPFFTTKPVGKGTGLGLSLCYQIVVKGHKGRIRCISNTEGTESIVELPVKASGEVKDEA